MDIQAQAAQAAQQGQKLLADDQAKTASASDQYNSFNSQATDANKNLQDQTKYMQGEGSGQNVYNNELDTMENKAGYNPQQLSDANKSLFSMTGAMNSANNSFSQPGGVGAYGMSAPALASYEGSILNPLQTGVANANTEVGALNSELGTFQTGASQATTSQVQSEQNTATALDSAVKNYQSQAAAALQDMQFYSDLARQQGGMNAQQQQMYAQTTQLYAAAKQAEAQAGLLLSQTTGQNLTNQQTQTAMDLAKAKALNAPAPPHPNNAPAAAPASSHNQYFNVNSSNGGSLVGSLAKDAWNGFVSPINWAMGWGNEGKINNG